MFQQARRFLSQPALRQVGQSILTARGAFATTLSQQSRPLLTQIFSRWTHTTVPQSSSPFAEPDRQAWVTQLDGTKIGMTSLSSYVFAAAPRTDILHRVVVWQLAKRRAGLASTKGRKEVSGGGKKIFPQKGRGSARHASIRAPQFRKGGIAHGPKPRDYGYALPKAIRRYGLRIALSIKFAQGDLTIVDRLVADTHKTGKFDELIRKRGASNSKTVLLVGGEELPENVLKASLNIPYCQAMSVRGLNTYDMLTYKKVVLSLDAVRYLEEVLFADRK
eukprot:comp21325_c0_seq1/m.29209 comp21325_c0_seq1/g.29209  ORF comp21325_c0_seq1/g.29209 comp21325_c0_seq1/m.29209 type:complete len:277 (-) comp21325_c0_seq1:719-1549(-)